MSVLSLAIPFFPVASFSCVVVYFVLTYLHLSSLLLVILPLRLEAVFFDLRSNHFYRPVAYKQALRGYIYIFIYCA
jgi:hypothetical protein